ncbi:hypothetical protein TMatcc_001398 [Talaromyces marneffei ATCC 18224]|uniref:EKC/KEOPS complex subunit GON7 n=2 Tax=Talaromyces marneffei TaxID=37727 RepID=B6QK16_TALMQ|nr:uncharacterized protein EYB26_007371 [Talaromyces marneffei]EEA22548.1 conserved hypothetical protein [Talaromyces marneffei ATCC 18224]KAE8551446.1 hypothetical protein EYB25_005336 [Talaromyces marneffei]QGA19682.1 hypothetical protein EYB26_007371 [Talaromyces marneffei]
MTTAKPAVSASYSSPQPPHTSFTFRHEIAAPFPSEKSDSVAAKKAYLSELRGLVTLVQAEVNVFLTERMEEDKKSAGGATGKDAEQEAKDEENYGEENVEDDT